MDPQPLFTIGHSNHAPEVFLSLLLAHNVAHVVDVRSFPSSRYSPQYNQPALKAALAQAGITYHWAGKELGGRSRLPYAQLRSTAAFRHALKDLQRQSQKEPTAIMCAEEDPFDCHRRFLITRALLEDLNFPAVLHIRKDFSLLPEPGFPASPLQLSLAME